MLNNKKAKKLDIAIFHFAFVYSGGGEKLVLEEALGLQKLGHKVSVFAPVVEASKSFPDLIKKVKVRAFLPGIPKFIIEWESFQIILTCVLAPFISFKFRKFDVIFAANQPSPWIALWVKLFFKVPYVSYLAQPTRFLYPRNVDLENGLIFVRKHRLSIATRLLKVLRPLTLRFDLLSIRKSNLVLTNGKYMKNITSKIYGIETVSCPAGANPVNNIVSYVQRQAPNFYIGKRLINKPYILLTNRHFPQKRFEYAITALPSILQKSPDISLVITGKETEYTQNLKNLIRELSLEDRIIFTGYVDEKDLTKLYKNSLLYVYTAPEEDFGMGIIEAMAAGTPVVAWNNAGPSMIIENGKDGLLAKPFEIVDYVGKISSILSNSCLVDRLSQNALIKVKNEYSNQRHSRFLEESFFSILSNEKEI